MTDFFSEIQTTALFDLSHCVAGTYLSCYRYPWEALDGIATWIMEAASHLFPSEYREIGENIWAHKTAIIADSASIHGPCIICSGAEIRHCAFVRGNAVIGERCVVGNSTELKNVILFDRVQVPHYNYVGDSILGYGAHMGAGSITSNVKGNKGEVIVHCQSGEINTGRKKLGAMLGDGAEIGCNTVLNPGTIVGKNTQIYPLSLVRGTIGSDMIYKAPQNMVLKQIPMGAERND